MVWLEKAKPAAESGANGVISSLLGARLPLPRIPMIAVVDDDFSVREALVVLLESMDFSGRPFERAMTLLEAVKSNAFDCVLSDMQMPEMDGLEFQRRLTVLDQRIPLIFVTSLDDPLVRRTALAQGAVAILGKPIDDGALKRALDAALAAT